MTIWTERERLPWLYGLWAVLALEPFTNSDRLRALESRIGLIEGPRLCSNRHDVTRRPT